MPSPNEQLLLERPTTGSCEISSPVAAGCCAKSPYTMVRSRSFHEKPRQLHRNFSIPNAGNLRFFVMIYMDDSRIQRRYLENNESYRLNEVIRFTHPLTLWLFESSYNQLSFGVPTLIVVHRRTCDIASNVQTKKFTFPILIRALKLRATKTNTIRHELSSIRCHLFCPIIIGTLL